MKLLSNSKLAAFSSGVMAASLAASIALNIGFYKGTLTSPTGAYCNGFYDGSINAIAGSTPQKSPVSAPVDLKRKEK